MFYKIVKYDLTHGALYRWKYYAAIIPVFITYFLMHFFQIRIFFLTHDGADINPTTADYIMSVLGGSAPADLSNPVFFQVPMIWISFFLWYLFIVLSYPYNELQGIGKHILVLTKRRTLWWYSKILWVCFSAILYLGLFLTLSFLVSIIFGAKPSLNAGTYVLINAGYGELNLANEPHTIIINLLLVFLVLIFIGVFEMVLTLIATPTFSFIFLVAIFFLSTYISTPLLVPNFGMICRAENMVTGGLSILQGIILLFLCSVILILLGWANFRCVDILRKKWR